MLPDNQLSSTAIAGGFLVDAAIDMVDYERGGIALNDPSQGLNVQTWMAFYEGGAIKVKPLNGVASNVLTVAGVTELSLAFDQNMRPVVAYVAASAAYLYWYDASATAYVTTTLAVGVTNPRVSLDDARKSQVSSSDVILAYLRDGQLCMRVQRDRYTVEYVLASVLQSGAILRQIGMSDGLRFQFLIESDAVSLQ